MEIILSLGSDNEIHLHFKATDKGIRDLFVNAFLVAGKDNCYIQVASRAVIAAGAGTESDDLERICMSHDAANEFVDLFGRNLPVLQLCNSGHVASVCLYPDFILRR